MKISTNFRTAAAVPVAAMLVGLSATAVAADKLDIGKMQYESACAVCHGRWARAMGR